VIFQFTQSTPLNNHLVEFSIHTKQAAISKKILHFVFVTAMPTKYNNGSIMVYTYLFLLVMFMAVSSKHSPAPFHFDVAFLASGARLVGMGSHHHVHMQLALYQSMASILASLVK
jgi:hypothetical protein